MSLNSTSGSGLEPDAALPGVPALADRLVAAALAVPGVSEMHSGSFGEVAAYLPGRRVEGVRLTDDLTEVHLTVFMHVDALEVAEAVRSAVSSLVSTPVDVYIEDVDAPMTPTPTPARVEEVASETSPTTSVPGMDPEPGDVE